MTYNIWGFYGSWEFRVVRLKMQLWFEQIFPPVHVRLSLNCMAFWDRLCTRWWCL